MAVLSIGSALFAVSIIIKHKGLLWYFAYRVAESKCMLRWDEMRWKISCVFDTKSEILSFRYGAINPKVVQPLMTGCMVPESLRECAVYGF